MMSEWTRYLESLREGRIPPVKMRAIIPSWYRWGTPDITPDTTIIDSTAIVIDDEVKALPEPKEGK